MKTIVQFSPSGTRLRAAALAAIAALATGCSTSDGSNSIDSGLGSAAKQEVASQQQAAQQQAATQPPAAAAPAGQTLTGELAASPAAAALPKPDENQDPRAYCPKTVLRAGTETYNVFPDTMKKDDPAAAQMLRFRGTITEIVRECNYAGEFLNIKVGVGGRLISGPAGETGQFTMPIRVAVTEGETVLYTKLHEVPAELPPGRPNSTFRYVDGAISIPKPTKENVIIYVGYDEQRTDPAGAQNKKKTN